MTETTPAAESLTLSDLTFEEAELLEDALDMSIDTIGVRLQGDKPKVKVIRALKWLELRRSNPEATFGDTAGISIVEAFGQTEPDPKASDEQNAESSETTSTRRSRSSTAT